MIEKVKEFISENDLIKTGNSIIISLSGGPDSIALLYLLIEFKDEYDIKIGVFHLNHMLRGEESDRDEIFCRDICKTKKIEANIYREDIGLYAKEKGISVEEAGRERRYSILDKLCNEKSYDKIATAHNLNDSVESALLNIFRGTGINGLLGIPVKRNNIIRPILCLRKAEILDYLDQNNIGYMTDTTNDESDYLRNHIRNEIIEKTEKRFNFDIVGNIARMSRTLSEDNEFIRKTVDMIYNEISKKTENKVYIKREYLVHNDPTIGKRLILKAIEDIKGDVKNIEEVHLNIIKGLVNKQSGSIIDLPDSLIAGTEFDDIFVMENQPKNKKATQEKKKVILDKRIDIKGNELIFQIFGKKDIVNEKFKKDSKLIYLDYDKIELKSLELRSRREGDVFSPVGRKITKKLKKYLIEERIPKEKRAEMPLLAIGNEIIWIVGYDYSGKYEIRECTKKVLVCKIIS